MKSNEKVSEMNEMERAVGKNIIRLRKELELTQESLAAKCDLSVSYISMLERGQRSPPLSTLGVLAAALGKRGWELLR